MKRYTWRPAAQFLLLILTTGVVSSCGGGGGGGSGSGGQATTVSISPLTPYVAAQGPRQFTATVRNAVNTAVTWEINGVAGGSAATGTITATGLYTAPASPGSVTVSAASQADSTAKASTTLTILARHSIAVRPTASGIAEFYDVASGNPFTPRGNNFIRLAWQQPPFQGWAQEYFHSTFNVGHYDSAGAESALAAMEASDYNTVRVFLNGCCINSIGSSNGPGVSSAYIANVVDFLSRAANHSIYVILVWDGQPPAQGGYWDAPQPSCQNFADPNNLTTPVNNMANLCSAGVATMAQYSHDVVQALVDRGARLDAIFAYELRNEFYFDSNLPPLSWTTGTVTAADGQTYDMSSATAQQQMMDNGLVFFTNQLRAAIVALDPTALVDVGFFWPQMPNATRLGDPRVIEIYPMMAESTADFVDLHVEPGPYANLTMAQYAQNYGFAGYQQQKPLLMGEFAAGEADYPVIAQAASVLQNWQVQSCAYSFKGWLLWTWNTDPVEQGTPNSNPDWTALSGAGEINSALAPSVRPDPCQ